jgi:hypothetical protein
VTTVAAASWDSDSRRRNYPGGALMGRMSDARAAAQTLPVEQRCAAPITVSLPQGTRGT